MRTANDYRAGARAFDRLARNTRDPQLKKHYTDLAAAFRELAKAQDAAPKRTRQPARPR